MLQLPCQPCKPQRHVPSMPAVCVCVTPSPCCPASLSYHSPEIPAEHHQHQKTASVPTLVYTSSTNSGFEHNPEVFWYLAMSISKAPSPTYPSKIQERNYSPSSLLFLPIHHHPNFTFLASFSRHIQVVVSFLPNRLTP